jgi:hypothetical protein
MTNDLPNTHEIDPDDRQKLKRECVCSACYGELVIRYDAKIRRSLVSCATPGCKCPGYVTRSWVERAKAKNLDEAVTARLVLSKAVPWMQSNRTAASILSDLGF